MDDKKVEMEQPKVEEPKVEGTQKKIINAASLFKLKKDKKPKPVSSIKRELLKKIAANQTIPPSIEESIKELEQITNTIPQAPPAAQIQSAPLYSSIKNGSKPTYRQFKKTFKSKTEKNDLNIVKHYSDFGKTTRKRKICVFIKSNKDRKDIEDEIKILDTHEIALIKEYLIKRELIKVGSLAPESLMRELYKNSILAGDIHNKNPNNLFHNFVHSPD